MAKTATLLDEVLDRVKSSRPGFKSWFDRLPSEAQAELEQVRAQFNPKVHQKRAFANAVMEAAKERGWETAGIQGVLAWLNKSV
jgi:hypothetical protein